MSATIYSQFHVTAESFGSSTAVQYEGRKWTYEKLDRQILLFAGKLARLGVKKGDVVAVLLPNCFASLTLFYAVNALGGISYQIHPYTPAKELLGFVKKSQAKFVVLLDKWANEIHRVLENENLVFLSADPFDGASVLKKIAFIGFGRLDKEIKPLSRLKSQKVDINQGSESDVAVYLNTGGTGGEPRIVTLTNGALNRLGRKGYPLIGGEVTAIKVLTAIPLCHGFGLAMGIHTPLSNGASTVLLNKFRTKEAISLIRRGAVSVLIGVPALYNALLSRDTLAGKWLQKQIIAFVGGDSVPESLLTHWNETMEKCGSSARLYQGYGLTETVNVSNANTEKKHRLGSVGLPLPGLSEIIVDTETRQPLPPLSHGEILIAGDTLMKGYLGENDDGFTEINGTRYVRTGDYGYLDEDGYLFFEQRLRRIVKINGETVCPSLLEKTAQSFYEIYEAYAYGSRGGRGRVTMHLALVLRHGYENCDRSLLLKKLNAQLKSNVPPFALPSKIFFLDSLPKTPIGKINDAELAKLDK